MYFLTIFSFGCAYQDHQEESTDSEEEYFIGIRAKSLNISNETDKLLDKMSQKYHFMCQWFVKFTTGRNNQNIKYFKTHFIYCLI